MGKLRIEYWNAIYDRALGTIRTVPENYYVASILSSGKLEFKPIESMTENINKNEIKNWYEKNKNSDIENEINNLERGQIRSKIKNKNNMKNELDYVANNFEKTSKVDDATDVWKAVREYMLSRTKGRYDTVDEMKDDINDKFKKIMESTQGNYDTWFSNELLPNYKLYDIEILGEDSDIVIEDEDMDSMNDDMGGDEMMEDGEDEMNDEINLEDDDEDMMNG
jgi:hypothetical protein